MTRRLALRSLLVVVVALLAAAVAPAAQGEVRPWPGRTITYFDATRDAQAVRNAVTAWNRTGMRMRFVRTSDRRRADIVIRDSRQVPEGCGSGLATVGYPGPGRQGFVNILHGSPGDGQACAWPGQTLVVAHELGHVLGLPHNDRACALMNSSFLNGVAPSRCVPGLTIDDHFGDWRCRVIEPVDVRRVLRLYGGRMRPVRPDLWCAIVARVEAPALAVSYDPVSWTTTVTLRRPATPSVPPFLANAPQPARFEVYIGETCPTALPGIETEGVYILRNAAWAVADGADETFSYQNPYHGSSSCVAAWAFDPLGRASRVPATVVIDDAPPAAVPAG
ncbi:MAG: M57 family metalloprotease [Thermoleophilia bacterium]